MGCKELINYNVRCLLEIKFSKTELKIYKRLRDSEDVMGFLDSMKSKISYLYLMLFDTALLIRDTRHA